MGVFSLQIEGKTVNRFIDQDSLNEFSQITEGNSIWDYRVDSLNIEFDVSILKEFDLDENSLHQLWKKPVKLYYYEIPVLNGVIEEIRYNFINENIEIEIYSWGKVVAKLDIEKIFPTDSVLNQWKPQDVNTILRRFVKYCNSALEANDYDYSFSSTIFLKDYDFPFLKTFNWYLLKKPKLIIQNGNNIICSKWDKIYSKGNQHYLLSEIELIVFNLIVLAQIDSDFKITGYELLSINNYDSYLYENGYELKKFEDEGILRYIRNIFNDNSITIDNGYAKFGDTYYFIMKNPIEYQNYPLLGFDILRIEEIEEDKFICNYEEGTNLGQIWKDISIMKNALSFFNVRGVFNFQNRIANLNKLSAKTPYDVDIEVIDRTFDKIELSENFFISDNTKNAIINYYEDFLKGKFIKYKMIFDRYEFGANEYPLILKSIPVYIKNKPVDAGIIKEVIFKEEEIEIISEAKIG